MSNMKLKSSTLQFLKDLAVNNNRQWFAENKPAYNEAKADYEQFIGEIILMLNDQLDLNNINPKDCIYRIFKDVRFSKDGTPYKAEFGATISDKGKKGTNAAVHLYLTSDGNTRVDLGTCNLQPTELASIREQIDLNPTELTKFLNSKKFQNTFGNELIGDKVKTAPRGYSSDNENIELLRYKNYNIRSAINKQDLLNGQFGNKLSKIVADGTDFLNFINKSINN